MERKEGQGHGPERKTQILKMQVEGGEHLKKETARKAQRKPGEHNLTT